jgi:hypothetical protein
MTLILPKQSGQRVNARKEENENMAYQRPTHQEIAARAYQLYLERGREDGHDTDDWFQAEYELMQLPISKLAELEPPARAKSKEPKRSIIELVKAATL